MQGRLFQVLLLGATLIPVAALLLPQTAIVAVLVPGIVSVSMVHVPSTAYLFVSRDVYAGVPNWKWTIVVVPLVLIALVFVFCLAMPTWALIAFMLVYLHFGIWHFGRQNLGVLTFSLRISCARPMSLFERRTINAGIFAGMCAAYTAFGPTLLLHPALFPLPTSAVAPYLEKLWYVGATVYTFLIPIVLYHIWKTRAGYDAVSALLYLCSVLFFLTLFIVPNSPLAIGAWATAHGLQYQLFLAFHAKSRMRTAAGLWPGAALLLTAVAGYFLWTHLSLLVPDLARAHRGRRGRRHQLGPLLGRHVSVALPHARTSGLASRTLRLSRSWQRKLDPRPAGVPNRRVTCTRRSPRLKDLTFPAYFGSRAGGILSGPDFDTIGVDFSLRRMSPVRNGIMARRRAVARVPVKPLGSTEDGAARR